MSEQRSETYSPQDPNWDELLKHRPDEIDRAVVLSDTLKSVASWCLRILIIVGALVVVGWAIQKTWAGVLPVILAVILCTVLAPPTMWLRRHKVPAALAALLSILGLVSLIGFTLYFIIPQIASQSHALYLAIYDSVLQLRLWLQGPTFNLDSAQLDKLIDEAAIWLQNQAGTIASGVLAGLSTVTSVTVTFFVIIVLTFFFLKDGHKFLGWLRAVTGRRQGWYATEALTRSWTTLSGFIKAQALVSLVDAFFIGIGIWAIGVPLALPLAVITFAAGFIPIVGAITAGALAVIIALVTLGFTKALVTLGLILLVQQLEGNVLSPLLQSRAMDLHPVIVLVSVTVGGGLFGILGAFLAVPVAAIMAVILRYFQEIMMLRSGECDVEDLSFSTNAGLAIATLAAEEGREFRENLRHFPAFLNDVDLESKPVAPTLAKEASFRAAGPATPQLWNRLRERIEEISKKIEHN
ncbi:AI-2E family transporter [Corynebacterium caspium]|uniref:AI-2E family transporter n=1 Tax=Corynebacterium caspium TaxID=234828 RepID=UPI000365A6B4|nr:AI-2E family transporter [Corynebacterium caspium]WKD59540.1 AI-2 transport protein TqsA [Corynebacterium caspium DSM 44850]